MEQFFSFSGRIGRYAYWVWSFGLIGILIGALVLEAFLSIGLFALAGVIAFIIGSLSLQVRRWHDRNKSAAWILINLVPFIGTTWAFVELGFIEGTPGPNQYGWPFGTSPSKVNTYPHYQAMGVMQPAWMTSSANVAPGVAVPQAAAVVFPALPPALVRCGSCNEGNEHDSRYCRRCGSRLSPMGDTGTTSW